MNNFKMIIEGFVDLTEDERKEVIKGIKDSIDIFRPSVSELTDIVLSFGPELYKLLEGTAIGLADLQYAVFKRHRENGFTRQEAMELITATKQLAKDYVKRK